MPCVAQALDDAKNLRDQQRRQAHAGFIEQQQFRPAHQRARHRQHLLLAAGQHAGRQQALFLQDGKQAVDPLQVGRQFAFRAGCRRPGADCLRRVIGPNTCRPSGTWQMPGPHARVGGPAGDVCAIEVQVPPLTGCTPEMARSRVVFPAPLAPTRATSWPWPHLDVDAVQGLDAAIVAGQAARFRREHGVDGVVHFLSLMPPRPGRRQ